MTNEEIARLEELFAQGLSDVEIGRSIGYCDKWIMAKRVKLGLRRPPKGNSKIDYNRLKELYDQGKADWQIAMELECSENAVCKMRQRKGLYKGHGWRRKENRLPDADRFKEIAKAVNYNTEKIALRLGISQTCAWTYCKKYGIELRIRRNIPIPPRQELEKAEASGKSIDNIGKMFGVSQVTIKRWFKHYGIVHTNVPTAKPRREHIHEQRAI